MNWSPLVHFSDGENVALKDFAMQADVLWDPALKDPATGAPSCIDACEVRLRGVAVTAAYGSSLTAEHGPLICPRSPGAAPCTE